VSSTYSSSDTGRDADILLQKVRKLMDKAAATTNAHEADAFARKAAELVAMHRIDPERLADPDAQSELVVRELPLGRGAYVRARLALLLAVSTAHDARVVFGTTPTGTIAYVAGFASDVDVVEVMYTSLHSQAAARMMQERRSTAAATQRFRRSFLFGYADRMGELLTDSRRATEASANDGDTVDGSALALLDRRRRVDAFAKESFGRVRTARAPGAAQASGWRAGVDAADRADVGRARLMGRRAIGRG
jgi:hypothetical protein